MLAYPDPKSTWGYIAICSRCLVAAPPRVGIHAPLDNPPAFGKRQQCDLCDRNLILRGSNDTQFVRDVQELAMKNYSLGGDVIIESMSEMEILKQFDRIQDVKPFCKMRLEASLNSRLGSDSDPELVKYNAFDKHWKD